MKPLTRKVLYGYAGFAVVNLAIGWLTSNARTGRQPGDNRLLDLNDSLLKFNVLARIFPGPAAGTLTPLSLPSQIAIPTGATITQAPAGGAAQGTTTTFGP